MRQGVVSVSSIGVLFAVLVAAAPAAAEEEALHLAGANDEGRRPFTLMGPLAAGEDAPLAVEGAVARDAARWLWAQAAPPGAGEEAPIPFETAKPGEPEPWPHALPFLAEDVIKQGYKLPLPLGTSLIYSYIARDIKITRVKIGVNGRPLRDVSDFVNLGSTSHVNVAAGRFDAWLLPFLNVYGLFGYVGNNTTTRGVVTIPPLTERGDPKTFNLTKTTILNGYVWGVGLTAAAGWREFFILGDFNYDLTDIGFDNPFRALLGTIRTGYNGAIWGSPIRFWVGWQYWGTQGTAKSTVNVPDVGSVTFSADQGPQHPMNALIGMNVTLFKRWEAFAEYGFNLNDVHIVAAGLTFRF